MTASLHLTPAPRSLTLTEGIYCLNPAGVALLDNASLYPSLRHALDRCPQTAGLSFAVGRSSRRPDITLTRASGLPAEGYTLSVMPTGISIGYADPAGAFYALSTLVQAVEAAGTSLPCMEIEDCPAFPIRGYMLDIGRNKVPTLTECERLCDWLASVKVNHVELYIEGIPFEYPSFPQMWKGRDVMTGEDILSLDAFCRERFIELVPTQNNFGHMDNWLLKDYRHLAECPDGFTFGGGFFPNPRCLDPLNPESERFVRTLADDFLPYFSGDKYNICCDETLELGQGHAKEAVEAQGKGRVYLDFLKKVVAGAEAHGRTAMFWDDIIINYPELLPELPPNVIALEWGYMAEQPSLAHCQALRDAGVRFCVCPGTGAWNTLLGKTDQMIPNIRHAAEYGLACGAEGLINTDWGDCGHPQAISTSYAGILYGAAMAWSPAESRDMDLAAALDAHVFMDAAHVMGQLALDAGNYFKVEATQPHNITKSFLFLIAGLDAVDQADGYEDADFDRVAAYLDELSVRLTRVDLRCADAALIRREYALALALVRLLQDVGHYFKAVKREDTADQSVSLDRLIDRIPYLLGEFRAVWLARNRYSYLDVTEGLLVRMYNAACEKKQAMGQA